MGKAYFNTYEFFEDYVVGYTSKGETFKVDLEDYEKIKEYYWYVNGGYLIATIKGKPIRLHRFIMNPPNNMLVDHINHDKTDNRKSNLRICTNQQNQMNRKVKGIHLNKTSNKWVAQIMLDGKNKYLGSFNTEEEAIQARKIAEMEYFGDFSYKV